MEYRTLGRTSTRISVVGGLFVSRVGGNPSAGILELCEYGSPLNYRNLRTLSPMVLRRTLESLSQSAYAALSRCQMRVQMRMQASFTSPQ